MQHKDITPIDGNHPVQNGAAFATEIERIAYVQIANDRGRVFEQVGGTVPGFYTADGAGGWKYDGGFASQPGAYSLASLVVGAGGIPSNPPTDGYRITNIYVEKVTGKLRVVYDTGE
jgi:hypothetical protein